jgi:lysophospholipase L1-like esterase
MEVLSLDVYKFCNVGNIFLRKETIGIPLPAKFIPSKSPRGDSFINSKILFNSYGSIQEAYVPQTVEQLNAMIQDESIISDSVFNSRMDKVNLQSYDPSFFTTVSGAISEWKDVDPTRPSWTQGTAANRPLLNGLVPTFDALNDRLDIAGSEIDLTEFTLYLVCKKTSSLATQGAPFASKTRLDYCQYSNLRQAFFAKAAGGFTPYDIGTFENAHVLSIRMNGSSSNFKFNDRSLLTLTNNLTSGSFLIGRLGSSSTGSIPFGGWIRALCVASGNVSDTQHNENIAYLMNKYSVPVESEYGVLGFGDSITRASGLTPWINTLGGLMSVPWCNLGVAGTLFTNYSGQLNNGYDRYHAQLITRPHRDYICDQYGTNDLSTVSPANFEAQYRPMMADLLESGSPANRIVVGTITRKTGNADAALIEGVNNRKRSVASDFGLVLCDNYALMMAHPDPDSLMQPDGLHLNQLGQDFLGQNFYNAIQA